MDRTQHDKDIRLINVYLAVKDRAKIIASGIPETYSAPPTILDDLKQSTEDSRLAANWIYSGREEKLKKKNK